MMEWILITVIWINSNSHERNITYKTKEICEEKGKAWYLALPPKDDNHGMAFYKCIPMIKK